jgi:Mitochondrial carrier protein
MPTIPTIRSTTGQLRQRCLAFSAVGGKKNESPAAKLLISGSVALVFELGIGHYMEFAKIAKQTSNLSYPELTRRMIQHKGILGVLDGFFPWGAIQCFVKGASFGFGQAIGKRMLHGVVSDSSAEVLSGGIGGGVQGVVLSPLLLLKTRVMTDPIFRNSGGVWTTTVASAKVGVDVVRKEGMLGLMKGSGVFTLKRVGDWTTRFLFAEMCVNALKSYKDTDRLSFAEKSAASFVGGAMSATATIPLDVLVATMQDAKKAGQQVRVLDIWKEKLREGGIRGIVEFSTRGFIARVAHVAATTLLMKTVASAVYKSLYSNDD